MILKNKYNILLITLLLSANFAGAMHHGLTSPEDFTGESIIGAPRMIVKEKKQEKHIFISDDETFMKYSADKNEKDKGTVPPLKKLRLKYRDQYKKLFTDLPDSNLEFLEDSPISNEILVNKKEKKSKLKRNKKENKNNEKQVVDKTSAKQSQDTTNNNLNKNEKKVAENKNLKVEKTSAKLRDRLLVDCEKIDYDTETGVITARGNVKIKLPEQGVTLYAQDVEFDKVANIIRANNKVLIKKGDMEVHGDYIVVDLNEENILLGRPITEYNQMEIHSDEASMNEGVISQENGSILFNKSAPFNFRSGKRGPRLEFMMSKKDDTLTKEIAEGQYKVKVTKMVIDSQKEHDTFLIQKATVYKNGKKVLVAPRMKFYTNKNHDYSQGDFFEIGSKRDAGLFAGPGVVFKLPKGSTLKAVPFVSYKSGLGYGGLLRFRNGSNQSYLIYGSQHDIFIGRGRQELDDNLYLEYATNDYMNEWFMGRQRPKYGIALAYENEYLKKDLFGESRDFKFQHRLSGGFYKDIDHDKYFKKLKGYGEETYRFKYMMQGRQTLWNKMNEENLTCIRFDIVGQVSSAVYGTGDTQVIARVGPMLHTQYKNWMQDVGYYQSAFQDNTPMPVFDKYRYGKSNAYLRETLKLNRWLALSWFASMTLSDDSYNNKLLQENSFYVTLGPDELRFNIGYDFVRENAYFTIVAALDPKGTEVMYDKLEIKNADNFGRKKENLPQNASVYNKPDKQPILRNAIVQNMGA